MKLTLTLIVVTMFFAGCTSNRSNKYSKSNDMRIAFLGGFLQNGAYEAALVDSLVVPEEYYELKGGIAEGARNNPEWFAAHIVMNGHKGGLPYHENIGVTQEQYDRFLEYSRNSYVVASKRDSVYVHQLENSIISVELEALTGIKKFELNLDKNTVTVDSIEVSYKGEITLLETHNRFKRFIFGHMWSKSIPEKPDVLTVNTNGYYYNCSVVIGSISFSNTIIDISITEFQRNKEPVMYKTAVELYK